MRTSQGEQNTEAYRRINPRGKVPALETEEGVLTESTAILPYLADRAPEKRLFPSAGSFERALGQAWLSYLSSRLHVALSAAMFPMEGCDNELARRATLRRVEAAFLDVDSHLDGRDRLLDKFSVCDLYLLVFALWRAAPAFAGKLAALPNLDRFQHNLLARPALAAIVGEDVRLRAEG